jgi:ATP-binding cassette subfamily C (CFTR/MRP) protein 4
MNDFLKRGHNSTLTAQSFWKLGIKDAPSTLHANITQAWAAESKAKTLEKASLLPTVYQAFKRDYIILQVLAGVDTALKTLQGVLIGMLVDYLSGLDRTSIETQNRHEGQLRLGLLCGCTVAIVFSHHTFWFWGYRLGARAKWSLVALIYDKLLRVSASKVNPGQITALITVDAMRVEMALWATPFLWLAPVSTGIILWILSTLIGWAGVIGIVVIVATIPILAKLSAAGIAARRDATVFTATRTGIVGEVINGIRMMKMFAWERPYLKIIREAREQELKYLKTSVGYRLLNTSYGAIGTALLTLITFVTYYYLGDVLTAGAVYGSTSLFVVLRFTLQGMFPLAVSWSQDCMTSFKSIEAFLRLPEYSPVPRNKCGINEQPSIEFEKFTATLLVPPAAPKKPAAGSLPAAAPAKSGEANAASPPLQEVVLVRDLSALFTGPKLIGICGEFGSGKSSILNAILGELGASQGRVNVKGSVSFVSQKAWGRKFRTSF